MQQRTAAIEEVASVESQVAVGAFQGAVTVVEQVADLEVCSTATAQRTQLSGLVVQTGSGHGQGAVTFDDAEAVVQCAAQVQLDLATGDLAVVVAAVVEVATVDPHQAFGVQAAVAVVEAGGSDQRFAGACGNSPAVVVEAAQRGQVEALRLNDTALAVGVIAIFQHAGQFRGEQTLQAGQHSALTVEVGTGQVQVAALGDDPAVLVVDSISDIDNQCADALDRATNVGEARCIQMRIGVLAIDQAISIVEDTATRDDCQCVVGSNGAAVAVIQLPGCVEGHQALADQLPGLVVDRRAAPQQQVTAAGQLAAGVGQAAQQVECHIGLAAQVTGAVVEAAAFEAETLLGRQFTGRVVQGIGFDGQPCTTVDQAVLAVVQQARDGQGLAGSAGEDAAAVVEAVSGYAQCVLADQRTVAAVEQFTGQGCNKVAVAAGQGAVGTVIEAVARDVQALPAGYQTVLVEQVGRVDCQHIAADQLAATVVEGAAIEPETLCAGDLARLVIQVANAVKGQRTVCRNQAAEVVEVVALHVDGQPGVAHHASAIERQCIEDQSHVTRGRHFAAVAGIQAARRQVQGAGAVDQAFGGVVDRCGVEDQAGATQHLTALVIEAGRAHLERLSSVDQTFVAVGEQTGNHQVQVVAAGQRTARVIEGIGGGVDTGCGDHAFDVGQRTGDAQGQQLVAEQFAAAVIELLSVDGERLSAGYFAVLVQNLVDVFQQQCARRVDQTALVVQLAVVQVQAQGGVAEQATALLTQAADTRGQCLAAANAAAIAVGQLCGRQVQTITAADATAMAVVEIPGLEGQQPFAADVAFLAVIKTGTFQVQRTIGQQLAALVAD
ncbi:putative hemagglutinin [Pseudomonas amygdali pv. morsprunorum]|nr:putative hemagglutinin [Pseudomonas amygdali pv. morsprunorum]